MKNNVSEKHQFALFVSNLSDLIRSISQGQLVTITDADFVQRVTVILRLLVGESLILFDQKINCLITIDQIVRHQSVKMVLQEKWQTTPWHPTIKFLLPLLKKEAFETAVYALTELGINEIQPVITKKSRQTLSDQEQERAWRIIIAAAEQSKNFAYPTLACPMMLAQSLEHKQQSSKLFFDPTGLPAREWLEKLQRSQRNYTLAIGPEGDLIGAEKEMLQQAGFIFCALTQTIVSACQAAALSAGIVRTFLR